MEPRRRREHLQGTIQELQARREALQTSNEALRRHNEDLRALNVEYQREAATPPSSRSSLGASDVADMPWNTEWQLPSMFKVFMDAADPIIIEDLHGRIVEINSEAERVYGWTREELLGQQMTLLWPEQQAPIAEELRILCRETDHIRNVECLRRTKGGDYRPILLTLSLLTDDEGRPAGIATIAKDIGIQKEAEREARDALNRRDHFLAMLSHELRNPLAAVLHATHVISHDGSTRDELYDAGQVIRRQTQHMARLLDDLLDASRVTLGKIRLQREVCDVTALARDAIEAVEPMFHKRRHELTTDIAAGPLYVDGDPTRIVQIQDNLLTNAAKYTPPGGVIQLTVRAEGNDAVIRVRDNGEGIPQQMMHSVFELFVQAEGVRQRADGGMGVGLTLVRELVELHHGEVAGASEGPGLGSEFVVRLPRTGKTPAGSTANVPPASQVNPRILIVEDNADACAMLKSLLELEGFRVDTATDGASGLEKILSTCPDVALVDIGLPQLDGYEVARRVRSMMPTERVRLVALTGYGRSEDHQAVVEAGFDLHLVKPVQLDELTRAIRRPR